MTRFLPVATNWMYAFTLAGVGAHACGYQQAALVLLGLGLIGFLIPFLGPLADWWDRRRKRRCSPLLFEEAQPETFAYFRLGPDGKLYPIKGREDDPPC